jgi:aspartyl-tRNA(Asn)/glutamyl-tRNA(Gln) amidotransferase subunit B
MDIFSQYEPVIGLEIHAQLASCFKMFCPDLAEFGAPPNTRLTPITLAHPGVLPSINRECVLMAVRAGLAFGCKINTYTQFARKNYFYPDLPKGYQITQDDTPICVAGCLNIRLSSGGAKSIRIQRIHLEEDAGKTYHDQDLYDSLIDFNRAGVGLIEIVSEPDLASAYEAMAYLAEIRKIMRYLDICDGNMEEGSLRCDANISVRRKGDTRFGNRVEVKNMNSISNLGRAVNYEFERQVRLIESGGSVHYETRTWDATTSQTLSLRDKETSSDYRYFPEPDLLPIRLSEVEIEQVRSGLPALPEALFNSYTKELGLPEHDAILLTELKEISGYFERLLELGTDPRTASNWLNGPVKTWMNETASHITDFPVAPEKLAELIQLVSQNQISLTVARDPLFHLLVESPESSALDLAQHHDLILNHDDSMIEAMTIELLSNNRKQVEAYRSGKKGLLGFFVGQVMKSTQGKADPKRINACVERLLNEHAFEEN